MGPSSTHDRHLERVLAERRGFLSSVSTMEWPVDDVKDILTSADGGDKGREEGLYSTLGSTW